jgi:hypothetical protein
MPTVVVEGDIVASVPVAVTYELSPHHAGEVNFAERISAQYLERS